jgi:uncharacterized protein (TIGR03067 family)
MHLDLDWLQGAWSIKSLSMDGRDMPASLLSNASIVVKENRFVGLGMGAEYEGTLDVDTSATPNQLNMRFDVGPEKGNVNLCIYELSGDVWKLCIATRGNVRPTAFATTAGDGFGLEVLHRKIG